MTVTLERNQSGGTRQRQRIARLGLADGYLELQQAACNRSRAETPQSKFHASSQTDSPHTEDLGGWSSPSS